MFQKKIVKTIPQKVQRILIVEDDAATNGAMRFCLGKNKSKEMRKYVKSISKKQP